MSRYCPFRSSISLTALATATFALLTPWCVSPLHAQMAQQQTNQQAAALSDKAKSEAAKSEAAKSPVAQTTGTGNVAAVDPSSPGAQKSLTGKAIDKVKEAAKSAGDIFNRVPCLSPKGSEKKMGSLPHVASKLASGEPVVIVAFGSSSTSG